jgi:hypothetical protein
MQISGSSSSDDALKQITNINKFNQTVKSQEIYIVSGRKNSCLNPLNKRKPFIESEIPKNTLSGKTNWGSNFVR